MRPEQIPPTFADMIHRSIYPPDVREWARAELDAAVDQMIAESEGRGPYLNQEVRNMLQRAFKGAPLPQKAAAHRKKLRYSFRSGALEMIT